MEENRFAHGAFAGAAAEDAALPSTYAGAEDPPHDSHDPSFASAAEEDAYWEGVVDGIRQGGGTPPPRLLARVGGQDLLSDLPADPPPPVDALAFDPVPVAFRTDGWTPERQREFVEALADCGIIRQAAARVGMTEQSVSRLRRRADASSFDTTCNVAQRMGARRLYSIAFERAVEGTVKRHYFHGELKAEERVYDNRLLIALINRMPNINDRDCDAEEVERNWEPWMAAVEQGLPNPPPPESDEPFQAMVWEDGDALLTNCPPPADFDGEDNGETGEHYERMLTDEEEDYWYETGEEEAEETQSWGMTVFYLHRETFFPWGSEPSEEFCRPAEEEEERSEASEASAERRARPADEASALAEELDRRHGFAGTPPPAVEEEERSEASEACGERPRRPADEASALAEELDRRHGCAGTAPSPDAPDGFT